MKQRLMVKYLYIYTQILKMIDFHIIGLLHGQNNLERYVTPMVGAFQFVT